MVGKRKKRKKEMDGKKLEYKGEEAVNEIERLTKHPGLIQESLLVDILDKNHGTEYLVHYMNGSKDASDFKKLVPVITYKGIHPYIRRIANGEDSSLITGQNITEMICRYFPFFFNADNMFRVW